MVGCDRIAEIVHGSVACIQFCIVKIFFLSNTMYMTMMSAHPNIMFEKQTPSLQKKLLLCENFYEGYYLLKEFQFVLGVFYCF